MGKPSKTHFWSHLSHSTSLCFAISAEVGVAGEGLIIEHLRLRVGGKHSQPTPAADYMAADHPS